MRVEFQDENNFNQTHQATKSAAVSGLTKWIIDKKIAKDKAGANTFMIIVSIICFAIAIYFAIR